MCRLPLDSVGGILWQQCFPGSWQNALHGSSPVIFRTVWPSLLASTEAVRFSECAYLMYAEESSPTNSLLSAPPSPDAISTIISFAEPMLKTPPIVHGFFSLHLKPPDKNFTARRIIGDSTLRCADAPAPSRLST